MGLDIALGTYPQRFSTGLGSPFEAFGQDWNSWRVDAETAYEWMRLPSALALDVTDGIGNHAYLRFHMGLHRDLSRWQRDPIGSNLPLGPKEVDLNEPSLGFLYYGNGPFAVTVGRFPVHWSPSSEYGLTLSRSVPYHNGVEMSLGGSRFRYRFLVSSLNPWLSGTPLGDSAGEDYPPGSEEYQQRHYAPDHGAGIFHNRVYDARIKTFFAHRLEATLGPLDAGVTEEQVIGGKVPDFRDAGPFVIFHNDFKDGYTNSAVGMDARLRLPAGFALLGEVLLDDVEYSATEKDGNTASISGVMVGAEHAWVREPLLISQSIHVVRTDPFLYGYLQPLNTLASRFTFATNGGDLQPGTITDRYVTDFPIGYLRGGDAFDFWYRLDAERGPWSASFQAGALSKGEIDLSTPYQQYYSANHDAPTGVAQHELRLAAQMAYRMATGFTFTAGIASQSFWNRAHVQGSDETRVRITTGVAYRFGG